MKLMNCILLASFALGGNLVHATASCSAQTGCKVSTDCSALNLVPEKAPAQQRQQSAQTSSKASS